MSFPKINYCLICEDVRLERGNKSTILGFYGITPDVEVGVADLTKHIDRLMFLLIGGIAKGPAAHSAYFQVLDDRQAVVSESPKLTVELPDKVEGRSVFAFGVPRVVFGKPGTFAFKLFIDGREHYKTTFQARTATPAELSA